MIIEVKYKPVIIGGQEVANAYEWEYDAGKWPSGYPRIAIGISNGLERTRKTVARHFSDMPDAEIVLVPM